MFLKPYKLKSNALLKGSENKRLRQRVELAFSHLTPEQMQQLLPNKANVSVLKLVTHGDFTTSVFCVDKLPMFFEMEGDALVPTLYALWLVPEVLPYFTTFPAVLPKLSNGADLMLPGVVAQGTGMNMYGRFKKGQLIAVNLTSNLAAVGVGYLPHSSDDLYMCGGRGSAVKMLHLFGDKLWAHEPGLTQQVPNQKPANLTQDDFPALGVKNRNTDRKVISEPVTFANVLTNNDIVDSILDPIVALELPEIQNLEIKDKETVQYSEKSTNDSVETTPEIILKNAFLTALKNHAKTLQLPLLTSNFYRLYVVPEAEEQIDLKKTKYKKLSNFLAEMIDQGFLVVREETKGVDKITSIDLEHPELVNFITDYKKPSTTEVDGQSQPLFHSELTELYIVTDEVAPFFTKMNFKRGEGIPTGQIIKIVREYVSKNNLPTLDGITKAIQLDSCLQEICDCSSAPLSKISKLILEKMDHSYQMCNAKDTGSNKPLIQMSLATRSGNKKVTLVSNVECYGIIVPEFIKLCKQGAAASTTIVKLPNQKREQLQIQGNQIRFIYNLLTETYKVPGKCILGLELAKDGKKHKKK